MNETEKLKRDNLALKVQLRQCREKLALTETQVRESEQQLACAQEELQRYKDAHALAFQVAKTCQSQLKDMHAAFAALNNR